MTENLKSDKTETSRRLFKCVLETKTDLECYKHYSKLSTFKESNLCLLFQINRLYAYFWFWWYFGDLRRVVLAVLRLRTTSPDHDSTDPPEDLHYRKSVKCSERIFEGHAMSDLHRLPVLIWNEAALNQKTVDDTENDRKRCNSQHIYMEQEE